eukprot:1852572-Pleurochrysis_carterae.AAC.8
MESHTDGRQADGQTVREGGSERRNGQTALSPACSSLHEHAKPGYVPHAHRTTEYVPTHMSTAPPYPQCACRYRSLF